MGQTPSKTSPGPSGARGLPGSLGPSGLPGAKGETGLPGAIGPSGIPGPIGVQGIPGPIGAQGIPGPAGSMGERGVTGPAGARGLWGPTGTKGETGIPGIPGPIGATGETGIQGITGPAGSMGERGVTGPAGARGLWGPTGTKGETGIPGIPGPAGGRGETGLQGPSGAKGTWNDFSVAEKAEFTSRLSNDTAFRSAVVLEISKNTEMRNSIREAMKSDPELKTAIQNALKADMTFVASVKGVKGDKGDRGDSGGITEDNKKNMVWCADGICRSKGHTFAVETSPAASDNKLYLTNEWQSKPDSVLNASEISNDTKDRKKLMIVGNRSGGGVREVGIWDNLTVAKQTTTDTLVVGEWTIKANTHGLGFYHQNEVKGIVARNGDIWEGKNKRWLSNAVDTERVYHVKAQDRVDGDRQGWDYLSKNNSFTGDKGATATFSKDKGGWQKFKFEL